MKTAAWLLLLSLLLIASYQSVDGQSRAIKQLRKSVNKLKADVKSMQSQLANHEQQHRVHQQSISDLKDDVKRMQSQLASHAQQDRDHQQRIRELYPNVTRLRPYSLFESISFIGIYARFHWEGGQWKKKISVV